MHQRVIVLELCCYSMPPRQAVQGQVELRNICVAVAGKLWHVEIARHLSNCLYSFLVDRRMLGGAAVQSINDQRKLFAVV